MSKKIFGLLTAVLLFSSNMFLPSTLSAHPGRTDSDGGHYCRTNCDYWGVPWNEWHSHGNSYAPTPTKKKVKVATSFHKKQCTKKNYHARHCIRPKGKKFHAKKCSKTILK